jgi:NADP-dependent 3-hydroxy acid dehydrogenase YdfG
VIAVNQPANKIALITGASSGIGAGIAKAFGAAVVASDAAAFVTGERIMASGGWR